MVEEKKFDESLDQLGEEELLNRLQRFMPIGQIEDDTAQINSFGKSLLINTDVLVEGVHFSKETISPENVGWKAIATNISDLACSGVDQILGITVGMIAPPSTQWSWVESVYTGIEKALNQFGGELIGGDCSCGQDRVLAITAIGTLGKLRLHRSNALEGDYLLTSGPHGLSRLGLALLLKDSQINKNQLPDVLKEKAITAHQRPNPPLTALRALEISKPKNLPWRAAGTDSSDGLLAAVQNICNSSQCQAVLDANSLPKAQNWPSGELWDRWCINGGEDFELIVSLPPIWGEAFLKTFPYSQKIGLIKSGRPEIIWNDGKKIKKSIFNEFKHF